MKPEDLGWEVITSKEGTQRINDPKNKIQYSRGDFLTSTLGVIYAEDEDNKRKGIFSVDKYEKMKRKLGKKASKPIYKWLLKKEWGKKLLYLFYGRQEEKFCWPSHIAAKTDVERIQNMPWVLGNQKTYVATEKVDGSSCSIMAEKTPFSPILKEYICSRNVVFKKPNQKCYYDSNIYYEVYEKYGFKDKILPIMNELGVKNIAFQMEIYGDGIQKRNYSLKRGEHNAMVFHIVTDRIKFPMDTVVKICEKYDLPHVPIVNDNYILPETIEELHSYVASEGSKIDGLPREGIVFYDKETGQEYFKFVDPNFLLKYHKG